MATGPLWVLGKHFLSARGKILASVILGTLYLMAAPFCEEMLLRILSQLTETSVAGAQDQDLAVELKESFFQ